MVAHGASRGDSGTCDQPGGRHIEERGRFIEVSPSGLMQNLCNSTHGSRRGLPSAALRAEKTITSAVRFALSF